MAANPTTGFQWTVERFDKKLVTLTASDFEKPKTNRPGAGGQMHFRFKLLKNKNLPANTELQFKYARSWEPESAVIKTVRVNFLK